MMQNKPDPWMDLLQQHATWYPLVEQRDIYKLVYQGIMGSEHLISSPQGFINSLVEEFEPLQADPSARLLEPIRPDRALIRVNLRPYKALHQPVEVLVPGLLETARVFNGDLEEFKSVWMRFVRACEQGQFSSFEVSEVYVFTTWIEGLGFPAVHHSEAYRRAYQPAYRLISARLAAQAGLSKVG
jgi:hypothetical protein